MLDRIQEKNEEGKTILFVNNTNLIVANHGHPFGLIKLVIEARKNKSNMFFFFLRMP
jgi:hypothetical protein